MVKTNFIGKFSWFFDGVIDMWPAVVMVCGAFALRNWLKKHKMDSWLLEHYQRIAGVLVFVVFFLWLKFQRANEITALIKSQFPLSLRDVGSILVGSVVLGFVIYKLAAKASGNRPQVEYSKLTSSRLFSFGVVWVIYLLFYEFYFRGVLLFMTFKDAPLVGVIAFNIILYAGVHIVKNFQQVLLSIPFGLLLVGMTYYTGQIWFALVIHLVLALSFEVTALLSQRITPVKV